MARILVIEDNEDNLELVRILLEKAGHTVLAAMDGHAGQTMALSESPDLILLDLTIPGLDGWTLATRLKEDPSTAGIVVVALTAHTLPGDRKKALDSGCDGYLTKPLDVPKFAEKINEFLAKAKKSL
jgi:two-component system cell cycle response regulator DivK